MPMWEWIAIGAGAFLGLSMLVGLVVARVLGVIGREITELYESEEWASRPPSRASHDAGQEPAEDVTVKLFGTGRLR
jgi:hypothetical protein